MHSFLLSCDWGTSAFRLRLLRLSDHRILAETLSPEGGAASTHARWQEQGGGDAFSREQFGLAVLQNQIDVLEAKTGRPLRDIPVFISGMASSSIGIRELPYAEVPFSLDGRDAVIQKIGRGANRDLLLISGLRAGMDVMRGEETQMIGLGSEQETDETAVRIFPGTHSKHILVAGGKITAFKTYITGELFNAISANTILKEAVSAGKEPMTDAAVGAFDEGIHQARISNLLHSLFSVRVNQLFAVNSREENYYYLSGLLIGTEIRDLSENEPGHIQLCSGTNLFPLYRRGLEKLNLGKKTSFISPEKMDQSAAEGHIKIALQYYG